MMKFTKIIITLIIAMFVTNLFLACGPKDETTDDAGDDGTTTQHILTINVNDNGSVAASVEGSALSGSSPYTLDHGTDVTLTATPDDGYIVNWSGATASSNDPNIATLTMDADKTITATFVLDTHQLNLTTNGNGSVAVSVEGSTLSGSSPYTLDHGTDVTLTATPDDGYIVNWSGDANIDSDNPNIATVKMEGDRSVIANFVLNTHQLNLTTTGNGSVSISVDGSPLSGGSPYTVNHNKEVTLTATPDTGHLVNWSDNVSVSNDNPNIATVIMDADKDVTVTFVSDTCELTFTTIGNGSVSASVGGSTLSGTPPYTLNYGDTVTFNATPNTGYRVNWFGDANADNNDPNIATVVMQGDKDVIANFNLDLDYIEMVAIEGGTFMQDSKVGSNYESFEHTVSDFYIGKYEVTYELWYTVKTWSTSNGYRFANSGKEGSDGNYGLTPSTNDSKYEPVTYVNWHDAIVWCNAYSEMVGYKPVYKSSDSVLRDSSNSNSVACDTATMDIDANGYRLPTEGEWQFASTLNSDGTHHPWEWISGASDDYNNTTVSGNFAWSDANSDGFTHPVGGKNANGVELHDMSGNIWEWCWDWYVPYPTTSQTDYICPNTIPANFPRRIRRGGSYFDDASLLIVGFRGSTKPEQEFEMVGFRVAFRP